jgi:Icc protein
MWGGLVAATPLVASTVLAETASADTSDLLVQNLECVTVTDTSVVITWFTGSASQVDRYGRPAPVATDTELRIGPGDGSSPPVTVLHDTTPTPYHYAEVHGLEPGTAYQYVALSNGQTAQQDSMQFPIGTGGSLDYPGTFTTLATPPGRYLFSIALCNDLHMGEGMSGIIENGWPPAFTQDPGLPPYPVVMLNGILDDLRQPDRGADRLIVAGDLTGDGTPDEVATVKQMLDGWGTLNTDYFVARGNHDRSRVGPTWASCTVVPSAPDHHDCWGDVFPYRLQELSTHDVGGLRVIGLDTTSLDIAGGTMSKEQLGHLEDILRHDRDRPTLLFGHHPVTIESAMTTEAGPTFDLDRRSAMALERLYHRTPGVFFHHSGHTHRNKRTFMLDREEQPDQSVEFLEVGASKEYPGGYSLVRIYTGGYLVSYYKTRSDLARQWGQRTRGEYYGLYPHYMLGTISDRNHTVVRDLSGLRPLS